MEPPPLPSSSGRFRLRVQIYLPNDAYNLNATPLRQFTIVKTPVLALPDLTLQELCDEVVKRFEAIYPGELLFAIEKPQDSYGSDLYLGDRVRDVFEDNEIFRVIKGATIRASVEPHQAGSQSVQPDGVFQYGSVGIGKRRNGRSEAEDLLRAQKRQRIITNDPDRPIRSRERDTVEREEQDSDENAREATVIQDSQETNTENLAGPGVNGVSQRITKHGQIASSPARESGSVHQRHSNPITTFSAPLQRIPAPPSGSISKDDAATSSSEINSPRSRVISQSKRKLNLVEDFSEQDRGQSTSTAVTTPLSVLQQPNHQSPIIDHKKLRRPTPRAGKSTTEDQQVARAPPRQNLYEVIETDSELPSAKPVAQDISSRIGNSYKWKTYRSSTTPNSDKGSSRRRRTVLIKEKDAQNLDNRGMDHEEQQQVLEREQIRAVKLAKQQADQERSRLAFEVAENERLDAEEKERERLAKLETARVAAVKLQQDIEAKRAQAEEEAKAEAMRQKNALAKAEAAKAAQLAEKTKLEAAAKARLEEQAKARFEEKVAREASEADKLRLEIDALRRAERENDLKEQAVLQSRQENRRKSERLKASLEATVRRAASTPAKAVTAQNGHSAAEATPEADDNSPASNVGPSTSGSKRVTCTPFIPRGRPTGFSPATLHPSQATATSLPRVLSPNVGLEDQMPMPPQLKRKVSFVDQDPSAGCRSSSASSTLKQTTLVPPRLGITNVKSTATKSTPKRPPLKANSNGSKPSKGKAKVVDSPRKPPPPTIEISSDEESTTNSSEAELQGGRFKAVGSPGPAYHKQAARQVLSPSKSQMITDVIELDVPEERRRGVHERETGKTNKESSLSPPKPNPKPIHPAFQKEKICSTPEVTMSHIRLSASPHATSPNIIAPHSQGASSRNSFEAVKLPKSAGSKQAELDRLETDEQNEKTDDDIGEDSTERPDDPEPKITHGSVGVEREDSTHLKEDQNEATDNEVEEESDSSDDAQPVNVQASAKNRQDSAHLRTETENKTTDEELEEDQDVRRPDTEDETTDEGLERFSDAMQEQVDDQLLTQPFERSSSPRRGSSLPNICGVLPQANKDVGLLQNHSSRRPSLRRMNLEAQRTRKANLEAAKARGLEKAQKMRVGAKPTGLLEESSEEASSSELSSTSSEYETDEDKPVANARSKGSSTDNTEDSHGELNNEDVEEMSQQLLAKSGHTNGSSSPISSALKPPSKGPDPMFRPTSKLQQNGPNKYGKKSGKIGWAKLGKQFSASKHKSGG